MTTIGEYYDEKYKDAASVRAELKLAFQQKRELVERNAKLWKIKAAHSKVRMLEQRLQEILNTGD